MIFGTKINKKTTTFSQLANFPKRKSPKNITTISAKNKNMPLDCNEIRKYKY